MDYVNKNALVSTEWLVEHLNAPDVRVVDASWYLPTEKRDPGREYRERHIPGAVFFDIDKVADTDSPLPHMLPTPEKFASIMHKLGLGDGNRIIVYDGGNGMSSARAWWMFRVFGHDDVAVLSGGLTKWMKEGRPVDDEKPLPRERHFTARLNSLLVRDKDQILRNIDSKQELVVDLRSRGRFEGTAPEPREGLRSGHIPGSFNLPYDELFDPETGEYLEASRLIQRIEAAGIDMNRPVIASCGSGVSACGLVLALHLLGHRKVAVYDGSWTEWGSCQDTPVETGA